MGHLDYYQYQATARGIHSLADIERISHEKAYVYDWIVRPWLPADATNPIAELACGHGSFLHWLKARGFTQVTAVDASAEQVQFARQIVPSVERADLNEWLARQPNASLQALVGIDLIEHIPKDDLMALLRNACQVLRPGGRLILRYPNGDSPLVGMNLFNDITHVWTYTPNCLDTLARMHGFARTRFVDESQVIRDHRWLKAPFSRLSRFMLGLFFRAAAKERIVYWGPNLWACLEK